MKGIYLLQVMFDFNNCEHHFENVYSTLELAKKVGEKWLEYKLRKEYEDLFEKDTEYDVPKKGLTKEQLFKLKVIYDFTITEFDPEYVDKLNDINNLPVVIDFDIYDLYCADLEPAKIEHSYDYNGKEIYISGIYLFNYNGKRIERKIMVDYDDYENPFAGSKFKKGDIVKIKENYDSHLGDYQFYNKLHVITDIPHKKENQKFFKNSYEVIVNHNCYDEGCHVDRFNEKELELYTENLPFDSPIVFLSKYIKGEIKLRDISFIDIECGLITLNEMRSFRDIPEIMEQMKGEKHENRI